jgi:hypothetical protein
MESRLAMECPKCGLTNPEAAQRCDCGYDFGADAVERPTVSENLSKARRAAGDFVYRVTTPLDAALKPLLVVIGIVAVAWWLGYTFLYAPAHKQAIPSGLSTTALALDPRQKALEATQMRLAVVLPHAYPRIDQMQGGNLDIYLSKHDFQEVDYPDRAQFVKAIGETWCAGIDCSFLPAVQFRDIRTGEILDTYSCCHIWDIGHQRPVPANDNQ